MQAGWGNRKKKRGKGNSRLARGGLNLFMKKFTGVSSLRGPLAKVGKTEEY